MVIEYDFTWNIISIKARSPGIKAMLFSDE